MEAAEKTLSELLADIIEIYRGYEATGTRRWTYDTASRDLAYQVGSLVKCVMQLRGDRFSDGQSRPQIVQNAGDELADILAEVLFIAHELDIDLGVAWNRMLASDRAKIERRSLRRSGT